MITERLESLQKLVSERLDEAETSWSGIREEMVSFANEAVITARATVESPIPGYPLVEEGMPQVDDFISLVADMRDSTKHLLQAISSRAAKASQLERVLYESAALLPCLAKVIQWNDGAVTMYLGDGVLALFKASPSPDKAIYSAFDAAKDCLLAVTEVVNPEIKKRYNLPELEIGVGMGYSKAAVSLVGLDSHKQPNVFGECVYRATKLSCERNEIVIDEAMHYAWPKSDGGKVDFKPYSGRAQVLGFVVSRW